MLLNISTNRSENFLHLQCQLVIIIAETEYIDISVDHSVTTIARFRTEYSLKFIFAHKLLKRDNSLFNIILSRYIVTKECSCLYGFRSDGNFFIPSQLLYLGRDYPAGEQYFKAKLKNAFMKHRNETDPEKIKMLIARGEYVIKEVEALYMLRKYRTLKQRYYKDESK